MTIRIKITDVSLNLAEKDDSIKVREVSNLYRILTYPCEWGEAMFGEECILGVPRVANQPHKTLWGESSFGEIGILGQQVPGSGLLRTHSPLNVIRTN